MSSFSQRSTNRLQNPAVIFCIFSFSLLFFFFGESEAARAQELEAASAGLDTNLSEKQFYYVLFDDASNATVFAKFVIENNSNVPLTSLNIEIPGLKHEIINIVQEKSEMEKTCGEFEEICIEKTSQSCLRSDKRCIRWETVENVSTFSQYENIASTPQTLQSSKSYHLTLARPIFPKNSGTVLIFYQSSDYAKKKNGWHEFRFLTIGRDKEAENVRMNIDVTPGLYLKYATQTHSYASLFPSFIPRRESYTEEERGGFQIISSFLETLDGYRIARENIPARQSVYIDGKYSRSRFFLYQDIILLTVLSFSIAVFLILHFSRLAGHVRKKNSKNNRIKS